MKIETNKQTNIQKNYNYFLKVLFQENPPPPKNVYVVVPIQILVKKIFR